jgi:hypothetical protein
MKKLLLVIFFTMFPVLVHGATYYVTKTGSDSNSCANAQNISTAKLTLASGLGCLSGGDTLQLGNGTYTDTNILNNVPSGSSGAPTIIQPINGQTAILKPFTCSSVGVVFFKRGQGYITFQGPGLIIDGGNCTGLSESGVQIKDDVHHLVFQDLEIRNTQAFGFDFGGGEPPTIPNNIRLTRLKIHNTGTNPSGIVPTAAYCVYINGQQNIVEDSEIYDCLGGWGIHGYAAGNRFVDQIIIRNNWIHNTNTNNNDPNGSGGLMLWAHNGSNNQIYNNISSGCNNTMAAAYVSEGSGTNLFTNNTVYGCQGGGKAIRVGSGAVWRIQNNIIYNNSQDNIAFDAGSPAANVVDHNLLGTDPMFVNAAGNDFHLQPGSPAIDAGVVISGLSYNGSAPDLGAFEFGAGGQLPAPLNLRLVVK